MKRIVCFLLIICIIPACSFADDFVVPPEITNERMYLTAKTKTSEYELTGIRFDLDDESMPVIIVKIKQKNTSERSISVSSDLWIFSYNPFSSGGSMLKPGSGHYTKEYLGVTVTKDRKGNARLKRDMKLELAPGEEYEWEMPYQIDNFSDPVYMYFVTDENSINGKWRNETIAVVPETGSVNFINEAR